jgi:CNT family concentrative nucleoside transporter
MDAPTATAPAPTSSSIAEKPIVERKHTKTSSVSSDRKEGPRASPDVVVPSKDEEDQSETSKSSFYRRFRPFILAAFALLILGWWISATVLEATRHRWIVQTLFAWSFIFLIIFRFVPNSVITKPVQAVWEPLVSRPFFGLSYHIRLAIGWLCYLGIVFGSAFGFPLPEGTSYGDRAISVFGLLVFQFGFYCTSRDRSAIPWPTVLVGLFFQQVVALFVLKSGAGFSIFVWIATLAGDFLGQAAPAAGFFFDAEVISKHWFFVNTLASIIFFIAFIQMMYYLGVMQWMIKKFAWFFFKTMNVSGAEAVVAAASPWIGQGESACLVRPYVDLMTPSEIHLTMTSGFSTIAGSVLGAYINLGVPANHLVTASVMSIPASIAISKLRYPETEEPVTRGQVVVARGEEKGGPPANALHAFSRGATFGLIVAGQILTNVLTILALVYTVDGLLTWIGRGFGIHHLTLDLIFGYIFYPLTFLLGVPRADLLKVSRLLGTKLIANEFVAYLALTGGSDHINPVPLQERSFIITSYALCGFANLASLGIQIGVLSALAPSRGRVISRLAVSAMLCGFISTMQTAGIAGMLV